MICSMPPQLTGKPGSRRIPGVQAMGGGEGQAEHVSAFQNRQVDHARTPRPRVRLSWHVSRGAAAGAARSREARPGPAPAPQSCARFSRSAALSVQGTETQQGKVGRWSPPVASAQPLVGLVWQSRRDPVTYHVRKRRTRRRSNLEQARQARARYAFLWIAFLVGAVLVGLVTYKTGKWLKLRRSGLGGYVGRKRVSPFPF